MLIFLFSSKEVPSTTVQIQPNEIRQLLIYPPGKGGISINTEDFMCLATDQYLNDIIIDFYLKWIHNNVIPEAQRERTHIFSTFFYKRLTTMTRHTNHDKDVKQTAAQKRHARVQNWTKNVNLFEKDFIIIPINEQSHWFLVIICFPRLKGPVTFDTNVPVDLQYIKKESRWWCMVSSLIYLFTLYFLFYMLCRKQQENGITNWKYYNNTAVEA